MKTRTLTEKEAGEVFEATCRVLGIPKSAALPDWVAPFGAVLVREALKAFCKANGLEPPPGL